MAYAPAGVSWGSGSPPPFHVEGPRSFCRLSGSLPGGGGRRALLLYFMKFMVMHLFRAVNEKILFYEKTITLMH
jgi:hypothetical protein